MSEPRDQELEDHLAGKSEVSRLYRTAPVEEPPPELDARIKAAARAGLTPRRPRWMLPLSAAAVLMLSVSVLLRMQQEGVSPIPTEEAAPGPAVTFQAPVESAPASIESEAASSAAPAPAPRAENPVTESRSHESRDSAAEPFPAAPAEAPVPAQRKASPQRTDEAAGAQNRDKSEDLMSAPPAADDAAQMERSAPLREPADWIEHIRRLRTEGRKTEAAAELKAFRERHPDYPLPEDLRSEP